MTDPRSALSRIASGLRSTAIAADALKGMSDAAVAAFWRGAADVLPQAAKQLDSLATSPLTVREALGDPEVRRKWIATDHEGTTGIDHRLVKIADDIIWVCRWRDGNTRGRLEWGPAVVRPADLDAPCRLVPAEETP